MQNVGLLRTQLICNTYRYLDDSLRLCFQLSARSEREFRALEVCEMMSDEHTLQLAIKYSSRMRFLQLAQRISEMAVRKAEEREAKAAGRYGIEIGLNFETLVHRNLKFHTFGDLYTTKKC